VNHVGSRAREKRTKRRFRCRQNGQRVQIRSGIAQILQLFKQVLDVGRVHVTTCVVRVRNTRINRKRSYFGNISVEHTGQFLTYGLPVVVQRMQIFVDPESFQQRDELLFQISLLFRISAKTREKKNGI